MVFTLDSNLIHRNFAYENKKDTDYQQIKT